MISKNLSASGKRYYPYPATSSLKVDTADPPDIPLDSLANLARALAEGPLVLDLAGAKLEGGPLPPPGLVIKRPGTQLVNGTLCLPSGTSLIVSGKAASGVELRGLEVSGAGPRRPEAGSTYAGLVLITQGASAKMEQCVIKQTGPTGQGPSGSGACVAAVAVDGGSAAVLKGVQVSGSGSAGIVAVNKGTTISAESCTASSCRGGAGLAALHGARLTAKACHVTKSGGDGFLSEGQGSVLEAGPGCTSEGTGHHGFCALDGGNLTAGEGCRAVKSDECGFRAAGPQAVVTLGKGCRAEQAGADGFAAAEGGTLRVAARCVSSKCQGRGFFAGGKGSKLVAGDECEAVESGDTGWQADEEGLIEAGAACRAEKGGGHGWLASDKGHIVVGKGSLSLDNAGCGFVSEGGVKAAVSRLDATACRALGNAGAGFAALAGGCVRAVGCVAGKSGSGADYESRGRAKAGTAAIPVRSSMRLESCTSKGHDQPQYAQYEGGEVELPA